MSKSGSGGLCLCLLVICSVGFNSAYGDVKTIYNQHHSSCSQSQVQVESHTVSHSADMSEEATATCGSDSKRSNYQNSPDGSEDAAFVSSSSLGLDASQFQLVPYRPSPILSEFHEVKRSFEFAGKTWTIHQQWDDIGLASVVWEAALLLSQYLEHLGEAELKGKRVIELGAGTGLVGLVTGALGAKSVVVTDKITGPAQTNLEANRHNLHRGNVTVAQFEWGENPTRFDPPFDMVLAADVIYIEDTFPLLLKSLADLSDQRTVILISCKRRYERDDRFFDLLRESGKFTFDVVWRWPVEQGSEQTENDVKVYEVRLVS